MSRVIFVSFSPRSCTRQWTLDFTCVLEAWACNYYTYIYNSQVCTRALTAHSYSRTRTYIVQNNLDSWSVLTSVAQVVSDVFCRTSFRRSVLGVFHSSTNVYVIKYGYQMCPLILFLQVRNLRWLGFRVPFAIVNQANSANQLYPHAVSLMESIRTFELTCQKVQCTCRCRLMLCRTVCCV